ncbi:hypothetical protein ACFOWA_14725 [Pedobacter lithocola]|uniref:TerB family tellurite resistance protein n=1 Tax=Pedobacter lithocola TaxID=1908239 RepID=A0ABV8PDR1_9SPHI
MNKVKVEKRRVKGLLSILGICCLLCAFSFQPVQAQTFAEWFSQKKKQKEYLLKQIAGLQVYIGFAKKGYDIATSGIHTIRDIKNGEFGLHSAFFGSLKAVSPFIRNNSKVADIIEMQLAIRKNFNGVKSNDQLSDGDREYIGSVREKVLDECLSDLEELLLVITSGKVEMTDNERIERLDQVYTGMKDKAAFTQSFTNEVSLFVGQKESEQRSINQNRRLYEIN